MRHKWKLIAGGTIAMALIVAIAFGIDGSLKTSLGAIIGYLFGTAGK